MKRDRADEPGAKPEGRRLLWKRKFDGRTKNREYEKETEITVFDVDGLVRFEVFQETLPPLAKRVKNDYVLFSLHPRELRTILLRAQEDEEAEA